MNKLCNSVALIWSSHQIKSLALSLNFRKNSFKKVRFKIKKTMRAAVYQLLFKYSISTDNLGLTW